MHALQPWQLAVLSLVCVVAGFVNTVAGAGSLLTLRSLMLFGFGPGLANGTNRVPVFAQSFTATVAFHRARGFSFRQVARASAPASLGALAGALGASSLPDRALRPLLILVLFAVGLLGLRRVKQQPRPEALTHAEVMERLGRPAVMLWLFFAGAYGGFLQAGVGLLLLHALGSVADLDLVSANALKTSVVAVFSTVAAIVYVARGQVAWGPALAMSVGGILGALLGVRYAVGWAHQLKVWVVVVDFVACIVLVANELL